MTARTSLLNDGTLRTQVTVSVLAVIVVLVVAQTAWSVVAYARAVDERLMVEAQSHARAVASDSIVQVAVWANNTPPLDERLARALDKDVAFAAVVDNLQRPDGRITIVRAIQVKKGFDAPLARTIATGSVDPRIATTTEPIADADAGNDDLGLLDEKPQEKKASTARVVVGVDRASSTGRLLSHVTTSMGLGAIAILVAFLLVRRVFSGLFKRVEEMREVAQSLADGDLTQELKEGAADEFGVVSSAVERMRRRWVTIVGEMRAVAEKLRSASKKIEHDAAAVAQGSLQQLRAADDAKAKTDEIVVQSTKVAERVAAVAAASTESQLALKEAREGTRSVAQRVADMRKALDENEGHRDELAGAAARIVDALAGLTRAVNDATRASSDVARRMDEANATASAIAKKAESALARSGDGLTLLEEQRKANQGVVAVTENTRTAATALSSSMMEVSSMAGLIGDIADMTSMLSLNASIIAAQAGGQSLGFATVADEIRSLAARTRKASTSIAERMGDAQHQIDVVTEAVHGMSDTVQAAQKTSSDATAVLESVLASMKGALEDAAGLAQLIGDAAGRTASVSKAVSQTSLMQQSIEGALFAQREAQRRLEESATTLRKEADTVAELGAAEDARTDALLARASKILAATDELVAASRAQTELASAIATSTSSVRDVATRHRDAVTAITATVADLNAQTKALHGAVRSLRTESPTTTTTTTEQKK